MKSSKRVDTYITLEFTEQQAKLLELLTRQKIDFITNAGTDIDETPDVRDLRLAIHKALTDQGIKGDM